MIRLVPFKIEHLSLLVPDRATHGNENHNWIKKVPKDDRYMAATFIKDGRVLGIIGFFSPVKGFAKCWAVLSEEIKKYPKALYKNVKFCVDKIFTWGTIKTLEADILANNIGLQRWIEKLGFKKTFSLGARDVYTRGAN